MNSSILLEVKDHSLYFAAGKKEYSILDHISFFVKKGEVLGIVGESGCGKTMLGNSIMGMYPPNLKAAEGEMYFQNVDLLKLPAKIRNQYRGKKMSMIFQNPNTSLNPVITIGKQMTDIIRKHEGIDKKLAKQRAIHWLEEVGLSQTEEIYKSYPHQLSGGMKQRVVIAMALSCNPELIVADEPTTALDVTTQFQILKLLRRLQKNHNVSIILVTHDMGVASYICDRIMVMYAGNVVEIGPADDILNHPVHPYTKGLLQCLPGNGKSVEDLYTIPGSVPSPLDFSQGCRYFSRCPNAREKCSIHRPEISFVSADKERGYACFYPEIEGDLDE